MSQPPEISVVIPVYRAETGVKKLVGLLRNILEKMAASHEIILVEDGSPDRSWQAIAEVCAQHPRVVGVKLSRNFGQHYAISAGLAQTMGRWVVVMDCDLQDQPSEIPRLLAKAEEGFEVVLARRFARQDPWIKRAGSRLFYGLLGWLTGTRQDPAVANFGIYSRKVIQAINAMPETIRYFPTMVRWVGFRTATVDVAHAPRTEGCSTYGFRRLFRLGVDICLANSDKPLRLVMATGFLISAVGFLFAGRTAIQAWRGEIEVLGYASLMVSIWVLAGLIILMIGVVGLYVGKSFEGIKGRPPFLISEILGVRSHGS